MNSSRCSTCTQSFADDQLYLLGAGFPAYCPWLYVCENHSLQRLVKKLAHEYPPKNTVFISSETGQGKTSTLRHIASSCAEEGQAVSWIIPLTATDRALPSASGQLLLGLRHPSFGPEVLFLNRLSSDEDFSRTVASTISSEFSFFDDRSEALTHMLMGLAKCSRRSRRIILDWLRGIPVPKESLTWNSELGGPPYEDGVRLATSVSDLHFYKVASFVSALLHSIGLEGLTVLIDDIDGHVRVAERYAESFAPFWRKVWPYAQMKIHKNDRLNFVIAGTPVTADVISVPRWIMHDLNPDVDAVLEGIAPKLRRCREVARHKRIQPDVALVPANWHNDASRTVRFAVSELVRETLLV